MKMSEDSESVSCVDTGVSSTSGVWHWGDPEDAQVTIMCHRVATDTIPCALCVIFAAPTRHNKNPLS